MIAKYHSMSSTQSTIKHEERGPTGGVKSIGGVLLDLPPHIFLLCSNNSVFL